MQIRRGQKFTRNSGHGKYVSRVLRPHRDAGYYETVIESGGHPALIGSIQIVSGAVIAESRS